MALKESINYSDYRQWLLNIGYELMAVGVVVGPMVFFPTDKISTVHYSPSLGNNDISLWTLEVSLNTIHFPTTIRLRSTHNPSTRFTRQLK